MPNPTGDRGVFVDRTNKDRFPIWECTVCRHKVAHDAIDPTPPTRCRGKLGCGGKYRSRNLRNFDPGAAPWLPGELAETDASMASKSTGRYRRRGRRG